METLRLGAMLKREPASRVVLETCAEAFRIADLAMASGHEVRVVPATLVKTLGVGARRIKTDRRDAQVLSEVSCRIDLPSVHVPQEIARVRRNMCAAREVLVSCRTAMINSVRGWARTQLLKIPCGDSETFPKRARKATLASPEGLPDYVDRTLRALDSLTEQIAAADEELEQLAKENPVCKRLMSVPGVGPITSLRFAAALDDRTRFPTAHAVQGYRGPSSGSIRRSSSRIGTCWPGTRRRTPCACTASHVPTATCTCPAGRSAPRRRARAQRPPLGDSSHPLERWPILGGRAVGARSDARPCDGPGQRAPARAAPRISLGRVAEAFARGAAPVPRSRRDFRRSGVF